MRSLAFVSLLVMSLVSVTAAPPDQKPTRQSVYDFSLVDINGKSIPLSSYKGKILLIVNLASQSSYSNQISALSDLQTSYSTQGLVVIGIPSPDFGAKELKDAASVRQYYVDKLHVAFPLFTPAKTRGVDSIPLYTFLCDPKASLPGGQLHWSFTKFIVDRDGQPLARYEVGEDPRDPDFHLIIESALAGKLKKTTDPKTDEPAGDLEDQR